MSEIHDGWERKWPQWPALKIQEWLKLDLTTTVYYHFFEFSEWRAVILLRTKHPEISGVVDIQGRLWPDWPVLEIQEFLGLELLTEVRYEPAAPDDRPPAETDTVRGVVPDERRIIVERA